MSPETDLPPLGKLREIFAAFLTLGLTAFGGPVAHLGYFHDSLVLRRRWLSAQDYADLVALCQFLPGPASSQVGFALGVMRGGGLLGGLTAFLAFTTPSALVLTACALFLGALTGDSLAGLIHGLKLTAVAVVAQALWSMMRTLTPDAARAGIALGALALVTLSAGAAAQVTAIAFGAGAGLIVCRSADMPIRGHLQVPISRRAGTLALALAGALLVLLPALAAVTASPGLALFDAFYRSGALVFGGGHVVLPLLEAAVVTPGWVSPADFVAGYGLTQAVPGPLFTFAAYLGAVADPAAGGGIVGAGLALGAIFLPGLLLVYGALPFWDRIRARPRAQAAMRGAGAAVVGLLGAAFHDPVWISAVHSDLDFLLACAGFALLSVWRLPPWSVVLALAVMGMATA